MKMGLRVEKKCVQRHLEKKDIHGAIIVRVVRSSTTDSPWFLYVEVLRRGSGVVLTERCVGIVMLFFKSRFLIQGREITHTLTSQCLII